jgi:hypothetical protein
MNYEQLKADRDRLRSDIEKIKHLPLKDEECERDDCFSLSKVKGLTVQSVYFDEHKVCIKMHVNSKGIDSLVLQCEGCTLYDYDQPIYFLNGHRIDGIFSLTRVEKQFTYISFKIYSFKGVAIFTFYGDSLDFKKVKNNSQILISDIKSDKEWIKDIVNRKCRLEDLPEQNRTYGVCLSAVEFYPPYLEDVPEHYKTAEMCAKALYTGFKSKWDEKKLIPANVFEAAKALVKDRKKKEMLYISWLNLVRDDWRVIEHVPICFKNKKMCAVALSQSPEAKKFIEE